MDDSNHSLVDATILLAFERHLCRYVDVYSKQTSIFTLHEKRSFTEVAGTDIVIKDAGGRH